MADALVGAGHTVLVVRADRHNPTSLATAVVIKCDQSIGFMKLTEVAGAFNTPHIEVSAELDADPLDMPSGLISLRITW